ncbi:MAG: enoyl-CoA hydratase/isomerase family protein [Deinococcales bacterium]|nr:enoyl-CoA hydratase/isomerase family protein [Deinococcales bacterium]
MPELQTSRAGAVLIVTLSRPQVRNALSRGLRAELAAALAEAEADDGVRAVVLTGAGEAFCAGLDLAELEASLGYTSERHRQDSRALADLFLQMVRFPKPLVAAVNGHAVAGGAGLVTACDVALMAEGARIGYTEARIGFVAALVAVLLVRQVGEKHARDLLLGAHLIEASEAARIGLVNEVAPRADVLERALARAERMAANAPGSLRLTKALLAGVGSLGLEDGLRWAVDVNALARTSAELEEGVRAFLEKREPRWRAAGLAEPPPQQ